MRKRKSGFTLVELSIVLVIIGLLIGGILVAQSMINTTRITAQVRQIQQFDIAVNNFKTKYNQLPGDSTLFTDPHVQGYIAGNNDGIIDDLASPCCEWHDGSEIAYVWYELSTTNTFNDGYQYGVPQNGTPVCGGVFVPFAKLKAPSNAAMPAGQYGRDLVVSVYGIQSTGKNYYTIFQSCTVQNWNTDTGPTVAPADLLALDTKIDDANGLTGTVVARANTDLLDASLDTSGNCVDGSGKYLTSSTGTCTPRIDMFSTTGGTQ